MVLDSHTHAWGLPSEEHPWVNPGILELVDDFTVDTAYTADKLLADMDTVGVDEAVVVGYPICDWRDNWYTVRAASEYDRLSGIVMVDPFAPDAGDQLRQLAAVDGVVGVRLGVICPYNRMWEMFDPGVDWLRESLTESDFWTAAKETDTTVQLLAHVDQLDQVLDVVETHPDLTYLLDHFSHADPNEPPEESAFVTYADLGEYDNVYAKVSEIQHRSEGTFPYADMHDHVRWLLGEFGRERVIWGSDFPNVSDEATYDEAVTWLDRVDELSDADRTWLRGRAFEQATGL